MVAIVFINDLKEELYWAIGSQISFLELVLNLFLTTKAINTVDPL
jgi:hypothetical protein